MNRIRGNYSIPAVLSRSIVPVPSLKKSDLIAADFGASSVTQLIIISLLLMKHSHQK